MQTCTIVCLEMDVKACVATVCQCLAFHHPSNLLCPKIRTIVKEIVS